MRAVVLSLVALAAAGLWSCGSDECGVLSGPKTCGWHGHLNPPVSSCTSSGGGGGY